MNNSPIPVSQYIKPEVLERLREFREVVEKYVPKDILEGYQLPEAPVGKNRVLLLPISGGSDSSCLTMIMRCLFPYVHFVYCFTDTRAESKLLYENLDQIEQFLDIKITRLKPEKGLFKLIDDFNGFLPNQQSRYCTKVLKLQPLDNWLNENFDLGENGRDVIFSAVAIRADESRVGMVTENPSIMMELPLVKMGIGRDVLYRILSESPIGISSQYKFKSRSGCFCCYSLRRSEKIGMFLTSPQEFEVSRSYEKLTEADVKRFRFDHLNEYLQGPDSVAIRSIDYLVPACVDIRTAYSEPHAPKPVKHKDTGTIDIFNPSVVIEEEYEEVFACIMHLVHPMLAFYGGSATGSPGTYWSELLTYSPSFSGIKRSLLFAAEHKLSVSRLYGLSKQEMRQQMKLTMFKIKYPRKNGRPSVDLKRVEDGSYSWGTGECYDQIAHHTRLIHQTLRLASLKKQEEEYRKYRSDDYELAWEHEEYHRIKNQLESHADTDVGGVIEWSGVFDIPPDDQMPAEIKKLRLEQQNSDAVKSEGLMACVACSL